MGLVSPSTALLLLVVWVIWKALKYLLAESSPNPFQEVVKSKVKPKILDQKKRDAVLKQGFSEDKVPKDLDAIVIGSGIGGLSSAAILAKAGKKVLVLEQHDQAGGCCHTFIEKGYEFDVGIHYIGEMTYQSISKTFVDQITDGQLEWEPLDDAYDEVIFAEKNQEPRRYDVVSGEGKWKEYLIGKFPEEADNIRRFFKLVDEVTDGNKNYMVVKFIPLWAVWLLEKTGLINYFTGFYKWNKKTCREVVSEVTQNQELRDIFCYCFGDYGTPPSKAGFPMQALLISHFGKGSSYPVGGASEIAFHIIPVIEAVGGKVLVRAEVSQIMTDSSGVVYGVEVKKGTEVVKVTAPIIISDAGLYNTFENLLPTDIAATSRLWEMTKTAQHGPGCLSVFVGLDCDEEQLEILHRRNAWVYTANDIDKLFLNYMKLSREEGLDADIPLLFISFPSTKDPEWKKKYPGKTTMAIVTLMPYEWVSEWNDNRVKKRGDEYEVVKKAFGHKAVEQACQLFPSMRDHIDYVSVGTPVSNNYYLGTSPWGDLRPGPHQREVLSVEQCHPQSQDRHSRLRRHPRLSCGAVNAAKRTEMRKRSSGLFLTGQDVCSCGFAGALFGGLFSAWAVLERNVMTDLVKIHKATKKTQ
ncbi:putative all-trans-retinol 13,14-reductase [Chionoecetes opilio]|uniref:Putative all-trans-retinol 13,14-reductase n=1 Tax=Chionoecetes opilio TaxID=41210 RepID=A0A8J5CPN3_CHIOP|nr:putative all-trans-retinol 13,14-reductase [Chionoecetes opilio]